MTPDELREMAGRIVLVDEASKDSPDGS